jgi:hypothetical protein
MPASHDLRENYGMVHSPPKRVNFRSRCSKKVGQRPSAIHSYFLNYRNTAAARMAGVGQQIKRHALPARFLLPALHRTKEKGGPVKPARSRSRLLLQSENRSCRVDRGVCGLALPRLILGLHFQPCRFMVSRLAASGIWSKKNLYPLRVVIGDDLDTCGLWRFSS